MRKSKITALFLAAAMVLSMTACSSSSDTQTSADTTAQPDTANQAQSENTESDSGTEAASDGETYKIGVLQLTQHAALDAANEGFIAALDESGISYEVDQQNASGDQSTCQTIASKLVNDGDD